MRLFFRYLRQHIKTILLYAGFSGIFLVFFALYQIPVEAAVYGAVVCGMFGMIVLAFDYTNFRKRYILLKSMQNSEEYFQNNLPDPKSVLEEEYQELLYLLNQSRQRMEDEKNQTYTDMIDYYTIWAHQIKTPIASMALTLQNQDHETSRSLLADLQRIEQYVDMVLCYLRLDSHTTDYVFREYELDGILKQAVRRYASQFIQKKIRLQYEPSSNRILTDEKWLLFVIEQILSNSLKYTKPGGCIEILEEMPGILCIQDTGMGIAPEDLPRIFEKGYTGYNGRSDKKASGIGLYLCRRICGNLGHTIWAESEMGKGTKIWMDLRCAHLTKV